MIALSPISVEGATCDVSQASPGTGLPMAWCRNAACETCGRCGAPGAAIFEGFVVCAAHKAPLEALEAARLDEQKTARATRERLQAAHAAELDSLEQTVRDHAARLRKIDAEIEAAAAVELAEQKAALEAERAEDARILEAQQKRGGNA